MQKIKTKFGSLTLNIIGIEAHNCKRNAAITLIKLRVAIYLRKEETNCSNAKHIMSICVKLNEKELFVNQVNDSGSYDHPVMSPLQ